MLETELYPEHVYNGQYLEFLIYDLPKGSLS